MYFLNINDPVQRDTTIEDYLALKKRLKECNMDERGYLMDRQRDVEETFELVVASNEKMAQDILTPINEGLQELNRNPEVKEVKRPQIGSKRRMGNS